MAAGSTGGAAQRWGWYVARLRAMSLPEITWRAVQAGRSRLRPLGDAAGAELGDHEWQAMWERFRLGADRPVLLDRDRAASIAQAQPAEVADLVAAAERSARGEVAYFGYPAVRLEQPVDWGYDPVGRVRWPARPAEHIDHRVFPGDPKWIWELNRLQHLCWLAEAWLFTGREEFAAAAVEQLDSWLIANPIGQGIAWRGAFEAGIRAISVSVALQGLREAPMLDQPLFRRTVRMLAGSADYCWRGRSRFSSANNHLVGDLAGLFTVATMLPELPSAPEWERRALRGLLTEADRQLLPDGAGAEQAVGYQLFTAELLAHVVALLRARGDEPPAALLAAVDRSADFLATLVGEEDPDPRYGDDDEGFALRLGAEPRRTVREHLGIVAALTGNPRAAQASEPTMTAAWLARLPGAPSPEPVGAAPAPASVYAPAGGLVVLRRPGRRIMMDVGPLGYLSIAAHGHADALAVTLSADGTDLVGDPGTGSYYGHPDWRRAHRGTRAHATATVDGLDQSVPGGPFLWTRRADVRVRLVDLPLGIVDAEHNGYQRLGQPVTHRRVLVAPPSWSSLLVVDLLVGEGAHSMCASWPLHPSLEVESVVGGHFVRRDGRTVLGLAYATSGTELVVEQVRGDTTTNLGWWSNRLESRTPAWLLSATSTGPTPLALAAVLAPTNHPVVDCLRIQSQNGGFAITWTDESGPKSVTVRGDVPGAVV